MPDTLHNRRIGLITDLPGWRNPTALLMGAAEMGAICTPITASLEGAETIEDLAGYLDNWFDCVAVRTSRLERLREFAAALSAPVVNLRTNDNHPVETLGDLSFVLSRRGTWDGLRVAVIAPAGNILRSWIEVATVLPIHVMQISDPSLFAHVEHVPNGVGFSSELSAALDADVIVTDCWPHHPNATTVDALTSLRVTSSFLEKCRPDVLFVSCPPVTRGQEVSSNAMSHPSCVSREAKAFLLHAQNAFLEHSMSWN
jgi:ornithine carbamoyltransferase